MCVLIYIFICFLGCQLHVYDGSGIYTHDVAFRWPLISFYGTVLSMTLITLRMVLTWIIQEVIMHFFNVLAGPGKFEDVLS